MKIISICNQKGGVGKTTTAVSLSSFLALKGKRVLLIDLDPQGNSTSGLGFDKHKVERSVYHAMMDPETLGGAVAETLVENLFLIPANLDLTGAEVELSNTIGREVRLRKALHSMTGTYDYVLIDCPPALGLLTVNALCAAHSVLIPIQCEYYALEGLGQLMQTIDLVRENLNEGLRVEGILMTMADYRTNLTGQVIGEVRKHFPEKTYQTVIPRNVKVSEAPGFGKPIMLYDKDCPASLRYSEFTDEFLSRA